MIIDSWQSFFASASQTNLLSHTALVAGAFIIGLIAIKLSPKRFQWWVAALLLTVTTPLVLIGFFLPTGQLGISDWDYYSSYHYNVRKTVVDYQQLPQWNPWTCGGTAAIGDPEFPLFTLTFLLELIVGIPQGFALAIALSVTVTALGMLALSHRLKLSVWAGIAAALAVSFGSVNLLEIVEGHPNIFSVMWLPWVFWAWRNAYGVRNKKSHRSGTPLEARQETRNKTKSTLRFGTWNLSGSWFLVLGSSEKKLSLLCGVFLALMFFQGGIYLLSYTAVAFLILILLAANHKQAFLVSFQSGLWAIGLAAIKLVPTLLWLQQFQDVAYASSTYTLPYLHHIFLGRYLHGAGDILPNQGSGWHEYGAYIGPIIALLALTALFKIKTSKLVRVLLIAAIAATLLSSSGPLLEPLFDQLPFIPRSNISRTILFAIIPIALLAGIGLDLLTKRLRARGGVVIPTLISAAFPLATLAIIAADLFSLSTALSYQAFVLPDVARPPTAAPPPISFTNFNYQTRHQGHDFTRAFAATKVGYGTLSYCSVLTPTPAVRTIHSEDNDDDIIAVQTPTGSFELISWTPNTVEVHVTSDQQTEVILNSNYALGWHVNGQPAREIANRVGTEIEAGTHRLHFSYHAPGLILGGLISLGTVVLSILALVKSRPRGTRKPV